MFHNNRLTNNKYGTRAMSDRYPHRRTLCVVLLCWGLHAVPVCGGELPELASLAQSILGTDQGVYVEATDGSVLVAQAASVPVHPASVSKVPTTLALLRKLGSEYRFVTTFAANGPVRDGIDRRGPGNRRWR